MNENRRSDNLVWVVPLVLALTSLVPMYAQLIFFGKSEGLWLISGGMAAATSIAYCLQAKRGMNSRIFTLVAAMWLLTAFMHLSLAIWPVA